MGQGSLCVQKNRLYPQRDTLRLTSALLLTLQAAFYCVLALKGAAFIFNKNYSISEISPNVRSSLELI